VNGPASHMRGVYRRRHAEKPLNAFGRDSGNLDCKHSFCRTYRRGQASPWTWDSAPGLTPGTCPICYEHPAPPFGSGLCLNCFDRQHRGKATGQPSSHYLDLVTRDEEGRPVKKFGKATPFIPFAPDPRRGDDIVGGGTDGC
jgi:hypothetical protein